MLSTIVRQPLLPLPKSGLIQYLNYYDAFSNDFICNPIMQKQVCVSWTLILKKSLMILFVRKLVPMFFESTFADFQFVSLRFSPTCMRAEVV